MTMYDTIQYVLCGVLTVCFGMAASMGTFLLGADAEGKRRSLLNAYFNCRLYQSAQG